ncbi:MAG: MBL fold metallo-hydrolase, partial [candidate division Zixibacteria bacterium]
MTLKTLVVGPFQVNCYLYSDESSADTVIIDPGAEQDRIIAEIDQAGLTVRAILLTHGHGDHIAGVEGVKNHFKVPLYIGRGEEELLANPSANVSALFADPIVAPPADVLLDDEQIIEVGTVSLRVLSTPGHSPGGVCYLDESQGILFCGDTLFYGSIGRTD